MAMLAFTALTFSGCCCPSEADLEANRKRATKRKAEAKKKAKKREKKIRKAEADSDHRTSLTIKVEVDTRKASREHWDSGKGKPDPVIKVWNRRTGRVLSSNVYKDRFNVQFLIDDFAVNEKDRINIRVEDKDIAANDLVGVYDLRFTPSGRDSGEIDHGYIEVRFSDETPNR